jgi:hypothetical protein
MDCSTVLILRLDIPFPADKGLFLTWAHSWM